MVFSDKSCDYCFALCVVLLITFQFWYGTPTFYENPNPERLLKSHLYVGSSSIPAGWTIYMCGKEKSNHMSYNVSVAENSKGWTRTIFGNASKMPIPSISKPPLGGILSYVLSKPQMENLENNPQIEQVYVEPLMHCLEPVKSCSKNTKKHKLVTNDIQCLVIANPNNYEVKVEFMVNFYVSNKNNNDVINSNNINNDILNDESNSNINNYNKIDGDNSNNNNINNVDDDVTVTEEFLKQRQQKQQEEELEKEMNHEKEKSQIVIDVSYSVFSVILKSG